MRFVSSIFFTLAIALIGCPFVYAQEVPAQMTYCGIELQFTPAARQRVQEHVQKITASPRYFNEMVKRACTFLPFVEEAFDKMDVPHDLKYLVIQESSLRATAVSPSKAVGFWQFKIGTAKEVGLRVDDEIDERMHIYRASEGAAIYLSKANYNFDNWVYSLLAYREGPTGALAYVNRENFGKQKMTIEEDVHPYIIKALAHKIAYQAAIEKNALNVVSLQLVANEGVSVIAHLLSKHRIDADIFYTYNPWIQGRKKRLPKNYAFSYFIPQSENTPPSIASQDGKEPTAIPSPNVSSPAPVAQPTTIRYPKAIAFSSLNKSYFAAFVFKGDLHYGDDFILYDGKDPLTTLATRYGEMYSELLVWNGLTPSLEPDKGSVIYLKPLSRCNYHIVEEGENIASVAQMHRLTIEKLQKINNLGPEDVQLYIGQKVYLRKKKPKGERTIVLIFPQSVTQEKVEPSLSSQPLFTENPSVIDTIPVTNVPIKASEPRSQAPDPVEVSTPPVVDTEPSPILETVWIDHIVVAGETLWSISQKYDTDVETIQKVNRLTSTRIKEGQKLRVLANSSALSTIRDE